MPTIKVAPSFSGLGVISSDVYIDGGNGASWYINQVRFRFSLILPHTLPSTLPLAGEGELTSRFRTTFTAKSATLSLT